MNLNKLFRDRDFLKILFLLVTIIGLCFQHNAFAQKKTDTNFFENNGISFTFGVHNNLYFQGQSQIDTSCIGTGSCVIKAYGLKAITPIFSYNFGISYDFFEYKKILFSLSTNFFNRRIKLEVDSLSLIENQDNYPLQYRNIISYDISPHCIEIGFFIKYPILKDKFYLSTGVKYTLATILKKKLIDFEGHEIIERNNISMNSNRFEFPKSVSRFYSSLIFYYNYKGINNQILLSPYLGFEMENKRIYYFKLGIVVPVKTLSNLNDKK